MIPPQRTYDFGRSCKTPVSTQTIPKIHLNPKFTLDTPPPTERSPESAVAELAKFLDIDASSLSAFTNGLRSLNANKVDITTVVRAVRDWDRVAELFATATGTFRAFNRACSVEEKYMDFLMAASSIHGASAFVFSNHYLAAQTTSAPVEQLLINQKEEYIDLRESFVDDDDSFPTLSTFVVDSQLKTEATSWTQFDSAPFESIILSENKEKGDFFHPSPSGKKHYNACIPSRTSWPKGDQGLIMAATGAISDILTSPLCIFENSDTPTKRIVTSDSLTDRSLYPTNLVRLSPPNALNAFDTHKNVPMDIVSIGVASLDPTFSFVDYQQDKYDHEKSISSMEPDEKAFELNEWVIAHLQKFTRPVLECLENNDVSNIEGYDRVVRFFKPGSSNAKEIILNPDYVHIASLNEAMSASSRNIEFVTYVFDVSNYVLMIPENLFMDDFDRAFGITESGGYIPRPYPVKQSYLDSDDFLGKSGPSQNRSEPSQSDFSHRAVFFSPVDPSGLNPFYDTNRAVLGCALLARRYDDHLKGEYADLALLFRTNPVLSDTDGAYLSSALYLALDSGYTTDTVVQLQTLGHAKYKKWIVSSNVKTSSSSSSKTKVYSFNPSSSSKARSFGAKKTNVMGRPLNKSQDLKTDPDLDDENGMPSGNVVTDMDPDPDKSNGKSSDGEVPSVSEFDSPRKDESSDENT